VGTAAAAAYYAFYARPAQLSAAEVVTSQKASVQQAPAVAHDLSRYISNLTSRQLEATDLGGFYEVYPQHRKAFKKLSTFCNAYPELLSWVEVKDGAAKKHVVRPGSYKPRETSTVVSGSGSSSGGGSVGQAENGNTIAHHTPVAFDAKQVAELLPMKACVEGMVAALTALSDGTAIMPVRQVVRLPIEDKIGVLAGMPSFAVIDGTPVCGMKTITVFPANKPPLSAHQGSVLLFDGEDGRLLSTADAHAVTAIRTAAASAVATDLLARGDSRTLCLLGTGTQALKHVEAIKCVRPINRVHLWGRNGAKAKAAAKQIRKHTGLEVQVFDAVPAAVKSADIICTLTGAMSPILKKEWVAAGTHINAVGACTPKHRELDTALVCKSRLFFDTAAACMKEPGDIMTPLSEGAKVTAVGEIGALAANKILGRTSATDITLFKSVGAAVEDLYAAKIIYDAYSL